MHDPKNLHVALLRGGNSSEREISLQSGEGAYTALIEAGYNVECLDPADKKDLRRLLTDQFDVAFICLHGEGGEDGCVQGFLETIGLPYTCSDVVSSACCMDKSITKQFYKAALIPTPTSLELLHSEPTDTEDIAALVAQIKQTLGESCVIKVPGGGSSIGVYIAHSDKEIADALLTAFQESKAVLVEEYIAGREVTDVVLDQIMQGQHAASTAYFEPIALPIIEIIPANDSYDYDSKYLPGGSKHICPAELPSETTATIKEMAVRAHKALGCSGVSRTDFIIDDNGKVWALETNTVPGMTQTSLLPDAARAAGIAFPDLCTQLIENALDHADKPS